MVYSDKVNRAYTMSGEVSDCGEFLIVSVHKNCDPVNKILITSIRDKNYASLDFNVLVGLVLIVVADQRHFEAEYGYISNEGNDFVFQSTKNAPNRKIVKIDITKGENVCSLGCL